MLRSPDRHLKQRENEAKYFVIAASNTGDTDRCFSKYFQLTVDTLCGKFAKSYYYERPHITKEASLHYFLSSEFCFKKTYAANV